MIGPVAVKKMAEDLRQFREFSGSDGVALVAHAISAAGFNIILQGEFLTLAAGHQTLHHEIPDAYRDKTFEFSPYAINLYETVFTLGRDSFEHIPAKLDVWLNRTNNSVFPCVLHRDMVSVEQINKFDSKPSVRFLLSAYDTKAERNCVLRLGASTILSLYNSGVNAFRFKDAKTKAYIPVEGSYSYVELTKETVDRMYNVYNEPTGLNLDEAHAIARLLQINRNAENIQDAILRG